MTVRQKMSDKAEALRSVEPLTILVQRVGAEGLFTVLKKLSTELLGQLVVGSLLGRHSVEMVAHVVKQSRVGSVHDDQASGGNVAINSSETTETASTTCKFKTTPVSLGSEERRT